MVKYIERTETFRAFAPSIARSFVILLLSVVPGGSCPRVGLPFFDKAAHFAVYFILLMLVTRGVSRARVSPGSGTLLLILILSCGYGILMELVQHFVPGRCPSAADAAANLTGILAGTALGRILAWQK